MTDVLDDTRDHFHEALQRLCDPDFSTRGGERPTLADLGAAYDHAIDAADALKALLTAPTLREPMTDEHRFDNLKRHLREALGCLEDDSVPVISRYAGAGAHLMAAQSLLEQLSDPPNPYANRALRPGLDVTNYEGKADV